MHSIRSGSEADCRVDDIRPRLILFTGPQTVTINEEFRDALWLRLGLPSPIGHNNCDPSPRLDPLGTSRLGFRNDAGARIRRHDNIAA